MNCDRQQKMFIFDNGTSSTYYRTNPYEVDIRSEEKRQYNE